MNYKSALICLVLALQFSPIFTAFLRVCYYRSQSRHRTNGAAFYPEDIDANMCSHVIYSFAVIKNDTLVPFEDSDIAFDNGLGYINRTMDLKEINPNLKVLLGVGGTRDNAYMFENFNSLSDDQVTKFANSAVNFIRKYKFDGIDLEWLYPVSSPESFTRLLETLRLSMLESSFADQTDNLTLSIAVSPDQAIIDNSYQIQIINELVDFVNVLAYDFHSFSENKTAFNSALYASSTDKLWEKNKNAAWAVNYWIENGLESCKLVLGIPLYGKGYLLADKNVSALGSPSNGPAAKSLYTSEHGLLPYFEICQLIKTRRPTEKFDDEVKLASIQIASTWIGYENAKSLEEKTKFIKDKCLGGFSVSNVDLDDWNGKYCNNGKFPLLSTLNKQLVSGRCMKVSAQKPMKDTGSISTSSLQTTTVLQTTDAVFTSSTPISTTVVTTTINSLMTTVISDSLPSTTTSSIDSSSNPTSPITTTSPVTTTTAISVDSTTTTVPVATTTAPVSITTPGIPPTTATATDSTSTPVDFPSTTTDLPDLTTTSALQSTSSAIPSTTADLSVTTTDLPLTTTAALSSTTKNLPVTTPALSLTTTNFASTTTAIPSTSPALPSTTTNLPFSTTALPSTKTNLPSTTADISATTAALASTITNLASTTAAISSTTSELSSTTAVLSSTTTNVPLTTPALPPTTTDLASTTTVVTTLPFTTSAMPSTTVVLSSTTTNVAPLITTQALQSLTTHVPLTTTSLPSTTSAIPTTKTTAAASSTTPPIVQSTLTSALPTTTPVVSFSTTSSPVQQSSTTPVSSATTTPVLLTSSVVSDVTTAVISTNTPSTSSIVQTTTQPITLTTAPITIRYTCEKTEILPSLTSCQHFQVCLLGFKNPVALIRCGLDYFFDPIELTCTKTEPLSCMKTTSSATTLVAITNVPTTTTNPIDTSTTVPVGYTTSTVVTTDSVSTDAVSTTTLSSSTTPVTQSTTVITTITPIPIPTTTIIITTTATSIQPGMFKCPKQFGYFANSGDCSKFWQCSNGMAYSQQCPAGLQFNTNTDVCDWKVNVKCTISSNPNFIIPNKKPQSQLVQSINSFKCPTRFGSYKHANDCHAFWSCSNFVATQRKCMGNMVFDERKYSCNTYSPLACRKTEASSLVEKI